VTSEGLASSDGQGPISVRSLDEIEGAKPSGKATNLNLKGIVSAVDADELTITVSAKTINVPATATIIDALGAPLTFADITASKRVHVTGKTVGGISTAKTVRVLDFAVSGAVSGLTGTCPDLEFVVDGQDVLTTPTTTFARGDCTKVADALVVEVQGTLDLGVLTALKVVLPSKIPPKPIKNVRVKGTISDMEGACPAKTFMVGSREVRTTSSTLFTGTGKCAAIADGKTVDITGVLVTEATTEYVRAVRLNVRKK
jgi:hypothetical protein